MTGKKSKTLTILLGCTLLLAGVFSDVRPAVAQAQLECPRPQGTDEAPTPSITAAQVEADPTGANLKTFAVEARNYLQDLSAQRDVLAYALCVFRREGDWKAGSVYIVILTADGTVDTNADNMALSGRQLREEVFSQIVAAAGLAASTDPHTAGMFTNPDGGALPEDLGGHAAGYLHPPPPNPRSVPHIVLAGFEIQESHLKPVVHDPADAPAVTAGDVVDRDTLKSFVNGAITFLADLLRREGGSALLKMKPLLRDEMGPWREGSVYIYALDTTGYIWFHAAFPNQYEFMVGGRARDAVTGELLLPQILAAAQSDPEGAFITYHFDDPNDDSDSAEIPKTVFLRQHIFPGAPPFILASGFYTRTGAPDTMTQFVPVVLDSRGKNNSHFTSELALTNRGSESAMLNFTYTAEAGGPEMPATATDMLGPHQQMIASNAIDYLRGLEIPIPETGGDDGHDDGGDDGHDHGHNDDHDDGHDDGRDDGRRIGTLRVEVSGSSDVSAVVRTTTPTAVPEGSAGLAYLGVPENEGFHKEIVYL